MAIDKTELASVPHSLRRNEGHRPTESDSGCSYQLELGHVQTIPATMTTAIPPPPRLRRHGGGAGQRVLHLTPPLATPSWGLKSVSGPRTWPSPQTQLAGLRQPFPSLLGAALKQSA